MNERSQLLNLAELRKRGWTPAMVRRLLGTEDTQWRNPFYRNAAPQRLYGRERVLAVECSSEFGEARAKSAVRAERSRCIAERKKADLLQEISRLKVEVTRVPGKKLRQWSIEHYRDRQADRGHYGASLPDGEMLDRLTVNFIRHELTQYDWHLAELFGRIGKEAGVFAVREKVYAAIAAAYPHLAAECERQLNERRPELPASASEVPSTPPAVKAPEPH